eukprot:INCI7452.1.p1 GENE.INCI7452.1~~INCI7452.1.p1  ORF type:complete len:261 (-),score=47.42 INCI7452.1:87-869(-)
MSSEEVYEFRPMVADDIATVRELHQRCLPMAFRESFYKELLASPGEHFSLVALWKPAVGKREAVHSSHHIEDLRGVFSQQQQQQQQQQQHQLGFKIEHQQLNSPADVTAGGGVVHGRQKKVVAAITARYHRNNSATNARGVAGEGFPLYQDLGGAVVVGGRALQYISSLAVSPPHRRRGLASHLLQRCVQDAKRRPECAALYLHAVCNNKPAIALYQAHKFRRLKRIRNLYTLNARPVDGVALALCVNEGQIAPKHCSIL